MNRKDNHIQFFDFADIAFSSFFIRGMFENQKKYGYTFSISKSLPALLKDPKIEMKWREILFSVCIFKAHIGKEESYFAIDCRDSCRAHTYEMGYHMPLLQEVKYYFKVNYNQDAIHTDPVLKKYASKIIPVPLFMPVAVPKPYLFFPRIIESKEMGWTRDSMVRRLRVLRSLPTLDSLKAMSRSIKKTDIFFVVRYYGEAHKAEDDFRYEIIRELKNIKGLNIIAGFSSDRAMPPKFNDFAVKGYGLKEYLKKLAESKVCLYVRGLHNALSFKFGQLLSLGVPISGQTLYNNKDDFYSNPYFKEQFSFDDPKKIVLNAVELLNSPYKMKTYGASNAEVFEKKYAPERVVGEILERIA